MAGRPSISPWTQTGIYTLPEAAHLLETNTTRIRRWLLGYRFPTKTKAGGESPPIFHPQLPQIGNHWAIGFLDLIELLFIKAFRDEGVMLPTIRLAARKAAVRWETSHPFCLRRFSTDGRTIFATVQHETGEEGLLEITRNQLCFRKFLSPYLKQMDYDRLGGLDRWWPLGKKKPVVLDPAHAFGRPVVFPERVPTQVIYQAAQLRQSEREISHWYEIPVRSIRAALEFEEARAA